MISHESAPNLQPIITHVPTQEQLEASADLNATHNPENALRPEQFSVLLNGLGYDSPSSKNIHPDQVISAPKDYTPDTEIRQEPFIESESERTKSVAEMNRLREEYTHRFPSPPQPQ